MEVKMGRIKEAINNVDEIYQFVNSFNEIQKKKKVMAECKHKETEYQPEEYDTNTPEMLMCAECGIELPLPEPDDEIQA